MACCGNRVSVCYSAIRLTASGRIDPVADGQATGSNAMYNGHRSAA